MLPPTADAVFRRFLLPFVSTSERPILEVTDWGVGILSMHSTYDVASKADLWALYRGFLAFFRS